MSRGSVRTVVNLAAEPQTVPLDRPVAGVLLAWEPDSTQPVDTGIRLPGHGVAVVRARPAQ